MFATLEPETGLGFAPGTVAVLFITLSFQNHNII